MNQDRLFYPLMYVVCGLLLMAGLLLCQLASAQTRPTFYNPDPDYWYNQYQLEHNRAEQLERTGKTAISGLQASLQVANDTIVSQDQKIKAYKKKTDLLTDRAETAEMALKPVTEERDKLKGKTVAGKLIRKARDGLAVVGGLFVLIGGTLLVR
ncbi:hypothetical protein [Spirosoma sp. KNUC1025]|uniref:hypothetical protein n=1 Tax=Spirosoma sp. KNUC1025 TaxID=2894082 RepID=UPI003868AED5|nr:hypothetical protein LN737_19135 [Spirosoma sp. KNUC1025]